MLPQYELLNDGQDRRHVFRIPFGKFAVCVVCLPLCSFLFCVAWSLLFFFRRSTATHCDVQNFLPSISAAIGNYQPQRIVWQLAICIHFIPRLIVAKMYLEYNNEIVRRSRRILVRIACVLNVVENFALLGLSLWTSVDEYEMHKFCFITFIVASELYMLLSYFLNANARKVTIFTKTEERSIRNKRNLFLVNAICFAGAAFCFLRHNTYCEPGGKLLPSL